MHTFTHKHTHHTHSCIHTHTQTQTQSYSTHTLYTMELFELFIRFARERVCRAPHIVSNTTVFRFVDQTVYVCVSRPVCVLHWKTYDLCVCAFHCCMERFFLTQTEASTRCECQHTQLYIIRCAGAFKKRLLDHGYNFVHKKYRKHGYIKNGVDCLLRTFGSCAHCDEVANTKRSWHLRGLDYINNDAEIKRYNALLESMLWAVGGPMTRRRRRRRRR